MASSLSSVPKLTTTEIPGNLMTVAEFVLSAEIFAVIGGTFSLIGVFTNLLNVRTFVRMGVAQDGMTLAFLLLSFSDLGLCCASLSLWAGTCIFALEVTELLTLGNAGTGTNQSGPEFISAFDPNGVAVFSFNFMTVFNMTTVLITIYLAVTRCLCVVRPLHFRNIISTGKTLAAVAAFFCLSLLTRTPVIAHMGMRVTFDPMFKASRPTLWLHPNREFVKDTIWAMFDMTLSVGAQVTLSVCVAIMARGLTEANKFRKSLTATKTESAAQSSDICKTSNSSTPKLNMKDARIIQQLVLISTIFITCNMIRLIRNFGTLTQPEFDMGARYEFVYHTTGLVTSIFDVINSTVNVFVYYTYNSKFKRMCSFRAKNKCTSVLETSKYK